MGPAALRCAGRRPQQPGAAPAADQCRAPAWSASCGQHRRVGPPASPQEHPPRNPCQQSSPFRGTPADSMQVNKRGLPTRFTGTNQPRPGTPPRHTPRTERTRPVELSECRILRSVDDRRRSGITSGLRERGRQAREEPPPEASEAPRGRPRGGSTVRIAILGGGPGGLYFAALAKQLDARHDITVWERNAADDTFGFGVVFSDETLGGIEHADLEIFQAMRHEFARWDDIDVHFRGTTFTSGGHGFAAMSRKRLLAILQARCAELGVRGLFHTEAPDVAAPAAGYILDPPAGIMQVHGYPYSDRASTFILEMHEDVWQRAGFAEAAGLAPGQSDEASLERIRELCADVLGKHSLAGNNSRWTTFGTVRCQTWRHENVVLIGDAAHTAHFSIGSGTKLAMEDALALAACLHEQDSVDVGLAAYEAERRPVVASIQRAAQASLEWFENLGQYAGQDPHQFAFNIMTRSRRVTYDNLRLRDPGFVAAMDQWFAASQPGGRGA